LLNHDHYEQLCAAAVTGQISEGDWAELQEHIRTCADCRIFVGEVGHVVAPALARYAAEDGAVEPPTGSVERFVARGHSAGIPLQRKNKLLVARRSRNLKLAVAIIMAILAPLGIIFWVISQKPSKERPVVQENVHVSGRQATDDRKESIALKRENAALREHLKDLEARVQSLTGKLATDQAAFKDANNQRLQIESQLNALQKDGGALRTSLADRDSQIAQLKESLNRASEFKQASEIAVRAEESELSGLRDTVATLSGELRRSEQLSAAANDAKDLIVARNLHIIDVHDNENGSKPRPFGRIFYTEGKKLVFYAYDLGNPQTLSAKVSFHVWGEKTGKSGQVKNLGIFRADDAQDGRWVLTFDDARVLAQVNTIFVTTESNNKKITKPNGNRILTAFLDDAPNHP
jgi:Skp family chaperone for outer membrane proteins